MAISPMKTSAIIQALTPLDEILDRFGIKYYLRGSMTSSVHVKGRSTPAIVESRYVVPTSFR
jgi:hypothetical protein